MKRWKYNRKKCPVCSHPVMLFNSQTVTCASCGQQWKA